VPARAPRVLCAHHTSAVYLSSFQGLIDRFPADFSDQCRLDYYMNYYMEAAGGDEQDCELAA
jgi:hypothetical protein